MREIQNSLRPFAPQEAGRKSNFHDILSEIVFSSRGSMRKIPVVVAPLPWVPWVPGNPSIFEQWVPEPINLGNKGPKYTPFLIQRAGDKG